MTRLFVSLYFGLLLTMYLFFIMLHVLNTNLVVDVYNIIDADNFSAEITLLNELERHVSEDESKRLLQLIAERNKIIIEPVEKSAIPLSILETLIDHDVWVDDEYYDYFKVFSSKQYYRMFDDESNNLVKLTEELDDYIVLSLIIMLAFCCFIWFFNLHRKLRLIETTVVNISEGDLTARVPAKKSLRVGRLNSSLNTMADKLEHLLDSHKKLTLSIAHEIRSPLFKMQLHLELLDKRADKPSQEHIQGLEDEIYAIEEMVEELLKFAQMERAELKPVFKSIVIDEFLELNCEKLQKECKSRIHLQVDSSFDLLVDKYLLSRAIKNLIINAEKYGNTNIYVIARKTDKKIQICIEDDGVGIAEENTELIFQPYYRQDIHSGKAGFGLGLSIVKEIVNLHNGNISVSNSHYGGAKFTLEFSAES